MEKLPSIIQKQWGWTGIEPDEVIDTNLFGNVIVTDKAGNYWRICPEDPYCKVIADNEAEYESLKQTKEFQEDWKMTNLIDRAKTVCGDVEDGQVYNFVYPLIFREASTEDDALKIFPLDELLAQRGETAEGIGNLPDGSKVQFTIE